MLLKSGCCFFYLFLMFQLKLETQLNIIIVEKNSSSAAAQDRKYQERVGNREKRKNFLNTENRISTTYYQKIKSCF